MNIQNKNGYSLIETIVYLAIFTVLSILVINSFIIILSSFNSTNINRKLLESGITSMERMSREIRQARSVNASSTSTMLVLDSTEGAKALTVKFVNENGLLNIYKNDNSEPEGNLLSQNVLVTSLIFRHITTTESEAIKIEMTLQNSEGNNSKSKNFYNTIILRGGY